MAHSVEELKKKIKVYNGIFVCLMLGTVITVLAAQLDFTIGVAVILGLAIALAKGTLVVGYFMHIFDEKPIIVTFACLTMVLFTPLMLLPLMMEQTGLAVMLDPVDLSESAHPGSDDGETQGHEANDRESH